MRANFRLPRENHRSKTRGMALVIVLAMLVLLTVMVLGFFNRVSLERMAASAYFESNRNRLLADQAVSIVQTQISHASTRPATAWASQPGLVRTFNQDGSLKAGYKLYSDGEMVADSISTEGALASLADWASQPARFVDLNAPVNGIHPILDPAAAHVIEGFGVDESKASATAEHPLPMPVKWLYVLQDGAIIAPEEGGDDKKASVPGATSGNPIVGRIAFWTDDETCKLNINTSSHGSFWDIPRAFSREERDRMARFQPSAREFQRYPGHPATASLAPVFGHLFGGPGNLDEAAFSRFAFQLAPRIQAGGSEQGTQTPTAAVALDHDRLYSSLDELIFDPDRDGQPPLATEELEKARFFLTARSNAPEVNLFNLPRMAIWPVNAAPKTPSTIDRLIAFCSTINGQPYYFQRAYPDNSSEDMTAFAGRNTALYEYLNALLAKPPPGFGNTSFASKYTAAETRQVVTEIFDYIRSSNLYTTAFGATPYTQGEGSGFPPITPGSKVGQVVPLKIDATKGFGRLPVISRAIFQLFVSGARMPVVDANGNPVIDSTTSSALENEFIPVRTGVNSSAGGAVNRTPPLSYSHSSGSILYNRWKSFLNWKDTSVTPARYHADTAKLLTSGIVYFDTFDPMYGYTTPKYRFDVRVRFSGPWTLTSTGAGAVPLNFPADSTLKIHLDHNRLYNAKTDALLNIWHGRYLGGPLLPQWLMQNYSWLRGNPADSSDRTGNGGLSYPLVSDRVAIHPSITLNNAGSLTAPSRTFPEYNSALEAQMGEVTFSGGSLTVELLVGEKVLQTYHFDFPGFTKPLPGYESETTYGIDKMKQMPVSFDFRHRWNAAPRDNAAIAADYDYPDLRLVQNKDVAVSLVPRHGDKRLLAAKSTLDTATDFQPQESYASSDRAAVDFRDEVFNNTRSKLAGAFGTRPGRILGITYGPNAMPDIPSHLHDGVQSALGLAFPPDFDNGTYHLPDDAYVNRADESSAKDTVVSSGDSRSTAWFSDVTGNSGDTEAAYKAIKDNESFYSPNRQMPSAVMFGSLPTGVVRNKPWQTLLFRPDPGSHPGVGDPPDHTLLDLFWMPVVEPYAISEPFSTNGKVNMNYQILPFAYLTRSTALYGVLQSEEILSVRNDQAYSGSVSSSSGYGSGDEYKRTSRGGSESDLSTVLFRKKIDIEETLKGFQAVFDKNEVFRSETQICGLPLVPEGASYSPNFEADYWNDRRVTGDNSRERPYANILPKLTTRSNTFTVHFRVQSLRKVPGTAADIWDEDKDRVMAEHRGSRTIERYIDPNDTAIPDYAASADPLAEKTLDQFYRWRVIANREFAP